MAISSLFQLPVYSWGSKSTGWDFRWERERQFWSNWELQSRFSSSSSLQRAVWNGFICIQWIQPENRGAAWRRNGRETKEGKGSPELCNLEPKLGTGPIIWKMSSKLLRRGSQGTNKRVEHSTKGWDCRESKLGESEIDPFVRGKSANRHGMRLKIPEEKNLFTPVCIRGDWGIRFSFVWGNERGN